MARLLRHKSALHRNYDFLKNNDSTVNLSAMRFCLIMNEIASAADSEIHPNVFHSFCC